MSLISNKASNLYSVIYSEMNSVYSKVTGEAVSSCCLWELLTLATYLSLYMVCSLSKKKSAFSKKHLKLILLNGHSCFSHSVPFLYGDSVGGYSKRYFFPIGVIFIYLFIFYLSFIWVPYLYKSFFTLNLKNALKIFKKGGGNQTANQMIRKFWLAIWQSPTFNT